MKNLFLTVERGKESRVRKQPCKQGLVLLFFLVYVCATFPCSFTQRSLNQMNTWLKKKANYLMACFYHHTAYCSVARCMAKVVFGK